MKYDVSPIRGMKDILPQEAHLRSLVLNKILRIYKKYGFVTIETPFLEKKELLFSSKGGDNSKLIYKILKRGSKLKFPATEEDQLVDSGLRYDLTVPLARYYSAHKEQLPTPFKVIQTGYVWRAERPQKGRFRQFMQCDIDIIGQNDYFAELDLILASSQVLLELGFEKFTVKINDRRILNGLANYTGFEKEDHEMLFIILDKLDKIGLTGVKSELLEKFPNTGEIDKLLEILEICRDNREDESINILMKLSQYGIDNDIISELVNIIKVIQNIAQEKYEIKYDLSLVRGQGYYTGTVFEITDDRYHGAIGGGGRYDEMIGRWTNKNIPACGISLGIERIMDIIMSNDLLNNTETLNLVLFFDKQDNLQNLYSRQQELINSGYNVITIPKKSKFGKQLKHFKEHGFTSFSILGKENIEEFD